MSHLRCSNEAEQTRRGRRWRARQAGGATFGEKRGHGIPAAARNLRCVPLHGREHRAELACGEIFQGAEAAVEFGGRQAPEAVERTQKNPGWPGAPAPIAFATTRKQGSARI